MKVDKRSTTSTKSLISKLTHEGMISNKLLILINSLTLEDLIAIKLELACSQVNNRLYGLDLWNKACYIIRDGLLKFAISTTQSKKDAARFLGLTYSDFRKHIKNYDTESYFDKEE